MAANRRVIPLTTEMSNDPPVLAAKMAKNESFS